MSDLIKNEHFQYEMGMMQQAYKTLVSGCDALKFNVYHECFMLHAYNLFKFLEQPREFEDEIDEYERRIEEQILTLDLARRNITNIKKTKLDLNNGDHKRIFELINECLKAEYDVTLDIPEKPEPTTVLEDYLAMYPAARDRLEQHKRK